MMTEFDTYLAKIASWKKTSWSLMMVSLMLLSTTLAGMNLIDNEEREEVWEDSVHRTAVQIATQDYQAYRENANHGDVPSPFTHPALLDPSYSDPGVMYGKIYDHS